MPAQTPQVLSRKPNGATPAEKASGSEPAKEKPAGKSSSGRSRRGRGRRDRNKEKKTEEGGKPKPSKPKQQQDGCKLVIRRLPPSMTEIEVSKILGETWEVGKGKADWLSFAKGKIPTDTAKSARPGRAYIYLTKKEDAAALDEHVRTSIWEDAMGTFNNACLIGPPLLEYSIYKKTPLNKRRGDTRQGTIDQDPEFMAFLEELASPPVFKDATDDIDDMSKSAKVTTTPLVEFLKEKKANKSKEAANKKREARAEKNKAKEEEPSRKKGKDAKQEKAPRVSVKILTKKGNPEPEQEASKKKQGRDANIPAVTTDAGQDAPKSRRAEIAAAAKALQRDQGMSPGTAHRKARQDAAKADAGTRSEAKAENKENAPKTVDDGEDSKAQGKSKSQGRKRGGKNTEKAKTETAAPATTPTILKPPVILKKGKDELPAVAPETPASTVEVPAATNAPKAAGSKAAKQNNKKQPGAVIQDGTRGFVRNVNSSQGVTADALREALSAFGTVKMVDVDRRKAFAYVDFGDAESLTKAIAASPVTVAQGSVTVMERKEKKPAADNAEKKDKGREKKEKPAASA